MKPSQIMTSTLSSTIIMRFLITCFLLIVITLLSPLLTWLTQFVLALASALCLLQLLLTTVLTIGCLLHLITYWVLCLLEFSGVRMLQGLPVKWENLSLDVLEKLEKNMDILFLFTKLKVFCMGYLK